VKEINDNSIVNLHLTMIDGVLSNIVEMNTMKKNLEHSYQIIRG